MEVALSKEEVSCCVDHCADGEEKGDKDIDCGVCNPLFSCANCSGFIVYSHFFTLRKIKSISIEYASFAPDFPSSLSFSIWQPPKLIA